MANALFALIPEARLREVLDALHRFSDLPLRLLDAEGNILCALGGLSGCCALLQRELNTWQECNVLHAKAGARARELGGSYIYTCTAGLSHIAFPLGNREALLGALVAGPFLMEKPDSTLISAFVEGRELPLPKALELYDELFALQVIEPARVQALSRLLECLLAPLLPAERALLMQQQEQLDQQSRLNEAIQVYKAQQAERSRAGIHEREKALLAKVRTGSEAQAKSLLNDLMGYVLYCEGGDFAAVRSRALELAVLASRAAMEGGASADSIYELSQAYLSQLERAKDRESLCHLLQDALEGFLRARLGPEEGVGAHIRRALRYMGDHYSKPLTLDAVAEAVSLSPNYLSALFRKQLHRTFREQLCRIRVEESKSLLLNTEYSLADIALAMGFADQSYYCKSFKRIVGIPPGRFRQSV